jgi:hypothetical protein
MVLYQEIKALADRLSQELNQQIKTRIVEMETDDKSHYLIYKILGISIEEGQLIDIYQNKGRFLYKYAGSFLEEAAIMCFEHKFPEAQRKVKIKNPLGGRPSKFEIDCLINNRAFEIKWRDATTTDGDHITKEHTRIQAIHRSGLKPMRIMFYYPNRLQAQKIQETLKTLYQGLDGEYYYGESAWDYIRKNTDIDLLDILHRIVDERE